jgi:hypothetical protein
MPGPSLDKGRFVINSEENRHKIEQAVDRFGLEKRGGFPTFSSVDVFAVNDPTATGIGILRGRACYPR